MGTKQVKKSRLPRADIFNAPDDFQLEILDPSRVQKRRDPDWVGKLINLSQGSMVKLAIVRRKKRAKPAQHEPIQLDLFDALLV